MVSISQSEERRAIGKKCLCGICDRDVFISLELAAISWRNFFTNHWACEVEREGAGQREREGENDRFKMGGT